MSDTAIEWADKVWNPVTGCSKVSQGCKYCYAERVFPRPYPGRAFTNVRTHPDRLEQPLEWRGAKRIFVNSMSDLFHEDVPDHFIDRVWAVMLLSPKHTFQVLTKRPERMRSYLSSADLYDRVLRVADHEFRSSRPSLGNVGISDPGSMPASWIWLGVSVEDQATADERIPLLLQTPAAVRFLSCEPLLGPIDIGEYLPGDRWDRSEEPMLDPVSWVIAGGESGPKARPIHPDWARSLRDQCEATGVAFFWKQWGEWRPPLEHENYTTAKGIAGRPPAYILAPDGTVHCFHSDCTRGGAPMIRVGKKAAGRLLDGREHSEFPA